MLSRVDGAYYGKISFYAPMYKGGGYNRPDLSHIPASAKAGGYIRLAFVSYTLVREDQRVYRLAFVSYTLVHTNT